MQLEYLQGQIHHTLLQVSIWQVVVWILLTATELVHQLKVSGARCIFTDKAKLPTVLKATKHLRLQNVSIHLIDDRNGGVTNTGINTIHKLLNHGEMEWERIHDIDVVSERLVCVREGFRTNRIPQDCSS